VAKLFLSYAREDAAIAERLAHGLQRSGNHDIWWDRDLHGGASFGPEIEEQLRDCDVVIVLWSPASIQSPWVRDEAAIGRDARKLVPLTLGGAEPPIGFRQFHTIDLGRTGRAGASAIGKLEQAITRTAGGQPAHLPAAVKRGRSSARYTAAAVVAGLLLLAGGVGLYVWRSHQSALTVAVIPTSGHSEAAADYANAIATDMASVLSARADSASILDPSDPDVRNASYRFSVGYSGAGPKAETSLSMAATGQKGIVWSQSWSVEDVGRVDLKKQMSFAASRAFLCALEARKGGNPLNESLLKLYIVACSGLHGGDISIDQVAANFSRIAEQQPRFAPAWANLAVARAFMVTDNAASVGDESPALQRLLREAISTARRLAPKSGKVLLAEAGLTGADWRKRLELLDRAIQLEPNEALMYGYRSQNLQAVGRMTDAVADATKAVELDPLSSAAIAFRVWALIYADRAAIAKEEIDKAYRIWPNNSDIVLVDFAYSLRYGDPRHAEQLVSKGVLDISAKETLPMRKLLIARENPSPANIQDALAAWRAGIGSRLTQARVSRYLLALGTFGKMSDSLQLVSDPRYQPFIDPQVMFRPEFEGLRHDPRFMGVAARFGLVRYWRSTGQWPDFCSDAGLPYDCKTEAAKYK
jgi:tetratricopeptide (TPR) repeat protein